MKNLVHNLSEEVKEASKTMPTRVVATTHSTFILELLPMCSEIDQSLGPQIEMLLLDQ